MKKINKLIAAALLLLCSATSCLDLDVDMVDSIEKENFYKTQKQFENAIAGVYGFFQEFNYFKSAWLCVMPNYGDDIYNSTGTYASFSRGTHTDTSLASKPWNFIYEGILNANEIIANAENEDAVFDVEDQRYRILAEAHMLRALFYYDAVRLYGGYKGIPLYTEPASCYEDLYKGQTPAEEVYKVIIDDLIFALGADPENFDTRFLPTRTDSDYVNGRYTHYAAHALLAEVYLTCQQWENAIKHAQIVINSNEYRLIGGNDGGYKALWDIGNESTLAKEEFIIYVPFFNDSSAPDNSSLGSNAAYLFSANGYTYPDMARVSGNGTGSGSFRVQPWFIDYFVNDIDGLGYSDPTADISSIASVMDGGADVANWKKKDYRIESSFFLAYSEVGNSGDLKNYKAMYPITDGSAASGDWSEAVVDYGMISKFQDENGYAKRTNGNDIPRLRLADMYLICAEAYNEINEYGKACDNLNVIRERSRQATGGTPRTYPLDINDVNFPEGFTRDEFRWLVFMERGLEFAGEMRRWFDLVRMYYSPENNISMYDYMMGTFKHRYSDDMWNPACVMASHKKYHPIPYQELIRNPEIVQNPGY